MAPRFSLLLLLLPILSLLFLSATARPGHPFHPCNTLIVSTYSFSLLPRNPNPNHPRPDLIAVVTEVRPDFYPLHRRFLPRRPAGVFLPRRPELEFETPRLHKPEEFEPLGLSSSFKDRTKDILSVVASLLFGAACGALTAGTMYLIWSIFNLRHGSYRSFDGGFTSDDDDNDDDDDIFNPKKQGGYVAIPAAPAPAPVTDSAPAPVSAKESA